LKLENPLEPLDDEPQMMSEFGVGFTTNVVASFLIQKSTRPCLQAFAGISKSSFMIYYLYDSASDSVVRTEWDYLPYALSIYDFYANSGCFASSQDPGVQVDRRFDENPHLR
jgi:hypothetical protein